MLKHITVTIIVDDHEPEKCGLRCPYHQDMGHYCNLFRVVINFMRCKECMEGAK